MSLEQYTNLYTWKHVYGDYVLIHHDGACSLAIHWNGFDAEMLSDTERAMKWTELYTLIGLIGTEYCAEFHFWREYDSTLADEYLALNSKIVRGHELAIAVREAMAAHLEPYAMANRVALVLTRLPSAKGFAFGAKKQLLKQGESAEMLLGIARILAKKLPGGHIVNTDEYALDIQQSFNRAGYLRGAKIDLDPRFYVSEQLLVEAPRLAGRLVSLQGLYSKVLLVHLYPDADAGWFKPISTLSLPYHISQIVIPVNTKQSLKASERASDIAKGTLSDRGRSTHMQMMEDLENFQLYVSRNGLSIFKNAYIIHFHGTQDELENAERELTDWIEAAGGQVRAAPYIQLPYFRAGQPGQGYRCPKFRTDETTEVANMAPVQVFRTGDHYPESLRLGDSCALIGFNTSTQVIPHSFTVAITGGGKGVDKAAQICETYPMGIDWYIAEIGSSYRMVVEGFGGVYSKIDPSSTVVNPLPPYNVAAADAALPLNATLAGGTVNALAFLLTDGKTELDVHQAASAQSALQTLYAVAPEGKQAPTLEDFLRELEASDLESEPQRVAVKGMAQKLSSFLDTTEGRIFAGPDNLVLSEGITGVDLKEVDRASPKLLKFYLVFLALRFNHMAFARRTPARVLLDEMHKFVALAPEVIGRLISELARMGRKDAAAIDIVTQGISEIDVIEKEVMNSMALRTLLYRGDEWETIASRIGMPEGPLNIWKRFPFPLNLPYRPAIKSVGPDYYNLHLTFPNLLLDLSASSPDDLDLKEKIYSITPDIWKRLELFRREKEARK